MNIKSRVKKIESKLFIGAEGTNFEDLLKPEFVYKGKPFDDLDEMYRKLNVVELPPYFSNNEEILLLEKGLISVTSIIGEKARKKIAEEMKRMM